MARPLPRQRLLQLRMLGFGGGDWFADAAYADMAAVADFNNDRYAITTVALGSVPGATAAQLKVKRAATFAEWFAFTASSTTARTYTNSGGTIVNDLAANAPRLTYANSKRQLRLENAATNLCLRSNDFNDAAWTKAAATVSSNAIAAPDGTVTADKLQENVASAIHQVSSGGLTATAVPYAMSVYLKAAERTWAHVYSGLVANSGVYFNLGAGTIGTQQAAVTSSSITSVGDGWYRCAITFTATAVTQPGIRITTSTGDGVASFAGTLNSGIYVWGAQIEASAFATDYIPTTTASVTRAIETARFSPLIEAILQRSAGSVVVRAQRVSNGGRVVGYDSGTGAGMIITGGAGGSDPTTLVSYNNVSVQPSALIGEGGSSQGVFGAAYGFDGTGQALVGNGGTVGTTSVQNIGATRTSVWLGRPSATTGTLYASGFYDFVGLVPERLSSAALQGLSVPNPSGAMWLEGDSYMTSDIGPSLRTATGRIAVVSAVGGATLTQAADRISAATYLRDWILAVWDGSANSYGSVAAYLAEFARIVLFKVDRFILIPPGAVPGQEGAYEDDMTAIRDGLLIAYPNNVLDWRATLFAMSDGGGTDTANVAAGVIPASILTDGVHLNTAANVAMAAAVDAFIDARGW